MKILSVLMMLLVAGSSASAQTAPLARVEKLLASIGLTELPEFVLTDAAPPGAAAYVYKCAPPVYIVTTSEAYQEALRPGTSRVSADARPLAGIIAHEMIHAAGNCSEHDAYQEQARVLLRLGLNSGIHWRQVQLAAATKGR